MIEIRVLGGFAVRQGGETIPPSAFKGRLVQRLIRVLVSRRGAFVAREALTEALWPDGAPADPERNLNVLVNRARRAIGDPSIIATSPGGYSITTKVCVIDSEVFLTHSRLGCDMLAVGRAGEALREFREALDRWGGEPLPEDTYEDWAEQYRAELNRSYLEALEGGASAALRVGDPALSARLAEAAVSREPLKEGCNLLFVQALAHAGHAAGALEAMAEFRRVLADELGLDPSPEADALETRILRGEISPPAGSILPAQSPNFDDLPFVGRDAQLQMLVALAGGKTSHIALLEGDAGMGKSRLLRETVARSPVPTLSVQAHLPERDHPWGLARSLLRQALAVRPDAAQAIGPRAARVLTEVVPELEELRPHEHGSSAPDPLNPQSVRALVLEGAHRLLEAALPDGALIIADDLQWADASSLALLELAVRRLTDARFIFAYRPVESAQDPAVSRFVSGLRAEGSATAQLRLLPLPAQAIAQLAAAPELTEAIVRETDCTPFTVLEVLRAMRSQPASQYEPVGAAGRAQQAAREGHHRAIELRMAGQPAESLELLYLLALLAREAPARLLTLATGAEQAVVELRLEQLGSTGLIRPGDGGWAIEHDLIAEVVAGQLARNRSGRLHQMLVQALTAVAAEPAEIARHLASAGDIAAAADAFSQAAMRSLNDFAHPEAERLSGAGLSLSPASSVRPVTCAILHDIRAEARFRLGRIPEAQADLRAALSLTEDGPGRSRIFARMAMLASGAENLPHAADLAELAVVEAGSDRLARAEALSVGAIMDMNSGRHDLAQNRLEEALSLFELVGNARGMAGILDGRAMSMFLAGNMHEAVPMFDRAARLFLDSGELLRVGTPRSTHGHGLVFMDQAQLGLNSIDSALELAHSLGHSEGEAYNLWHRSEALAALDRPIEAVASAQEALAIARRLGHREWTAGSLRGLGIAWEAAGDPERAEKAFRQSLDTSEHLPLFASWAAARLAALLISRGDLVEATSFVELAFRHGLALSLYEARLARVELAAAREDPALTALATDALSLAQSGGHMVNIARLSHLAEMQ